MEVKTLSIILENSNADSAFKTAVKNFEAGQDSELIRSSAGAPRIKVLRVLMKLLDEYPSEPITKVEISGRSSCSGFQGDLEFSPGNKKIDFNWDCAWKAEQESMIAWYGAPNQIKAVQIFGYQCFQIFEMV